MTDYQKLIDAETWAFIDKSVSFYPETATSLDHQGQRAVFTVIFQPFDGFVQWFGIKNI